MSAGLRQLVSILAEQQDILDTLLHDMRASKAREMEAREHAWARAAVEEETVTKHTLAQRMEAAAEEEASSNSACLEASSELQRQLQRLEEEEQEEACVRAQIQRREHEPSENKRTSSALSESQCKIQRLEQVYMHVHVYIYI